MSGSQRSTVDLISPFLWVGGAWGLIGLALSTVGSPDPWRSAAWNLGFWILCLIDFFGTAWAVRGVLSIRAGEPAGAGNPGVQALGGVALKLACFGLMTVVLWAGKEAPIRALLLGLGTMIIIPILGGIFWFKKEREHGDARC